MTKARDLSDLGGGITQADLPAEGVNESKLQVSNAPTNGYMLTAQSGNTGGMTWAEAPSGHWTNLADVTLGGSSVSAIDVTLPTGYDVLKLTARFPVCVGSINRTLEMQMLDSSNATDTFSYATDIFASNEARSQQNGKSDATFVLSFAYGEDARDYCLYNLYFFDVDSATIHTKWQGQGSTYTTLNTKGSNMISSGIQYNTAAVTSKARFLLSGSTSFASDDGCYYRLYGHSYS